MSYLGRSKKVSHIRCNHTSPFKPQLDFSRFSVSLFTGFRLRHYMSQLDQEDQVRLLRNAISCLVSGTLQVLGHFFIKEYTSFENGGECRCPRDVKPYQWDILSLRSVKNCVDEGTEGGTAMFISVSSQNRCWKLGDVETRLTADTLFLSGISVS